MFIPVERAEDGTPTYVITASDTDLGMAWRETTPEGQPYLLVKLDDPLLPHPIFCRLVQTGPREHTLLWDRVEKL